MIDWQSLALLGLGLWLGSVVALLLVRRFGVQVQPPAIVHNLPRSEPLHWVPTKQAGRLQRVLRERGFYVLNVGSTNGITALMICEGAQ